MARSGHWGWIVGPVLALSLAAGPAAAACSVSGDGTAQAPGSDAIVVCDANGVETDPVIAALGSTNVQIIVDPGGELLTGPAAIILRQGSVTNSGAVTATNAGTNAVVLDPGTGQTSTLVNNAGASIVGQGTAVVALSGTGNVVNHGTITTTAMGGFAISGVSRLTLGSTSIIDGRVSVNTLVLGGTTNGSFDQNEIGMSAKYQVSNNLGLRKDDSSTWTLTGTNSAAQRWDIDGGGLAIGGTLTGFIRSADTVTGASVTINTGGTITTTSAAVLLSGPGASIVNNGTVTSGFTALAVEGGGTIVNNGLVTVSSNNAQGLSASGAGGSITNTGTVSATGGGAIPAAVILTNMGSTGTMRFTNEAGGTVSSALSAAVLGSGGDDIIENHGTITGNAGVSAINLNLGNNTLILGTTSVINGAILGGGAATTTDTLRLLAGATAGSEDDNFGNFERVEMEENAAWTLGGNFTSPHGIVFDTATGAVLGVSGNIGSGASAGNLTKSGAGTLTLGGSNSYGGTTTINAGILTAAGGSAIPDASDVTVAGGTFNLAASETIGALAGIGNVALGANTITLGGSGNSASFSGAIGGTGGVVKIGSGTQTFTAGITAGYGGGTTVSAGTLVVDGSLVSSSLISVAAGATLKGIGILGDTTIATDGIHAPGNSIGTQTIDGDYTLAGVLEIEAGPGAADQLIVTGNVDLNGGTLQIVELTGVGWLATQRFTIIDNQGSNLVSGTFATVGHSLAFLVPHVSYDADDGNNVALTLRRNDVTFSDLSETANQAAAAAGAESVGGGPLDSALIALNTDEVPAALDQISGEVHAAIPGVLADDSRFLRDALIGRTFALLAERPGRHVWSTAYGGFGHQAGDGGSGALASATGGILFGADLELAGGWSFGFAGGIGQGVVEIPDRASTAAVETAMAGLYGSGVVGEGVAVRLGASYARHIVRSERRPAFGSFTETLTADYGAGTLQAFGELGVPLALDMLRFEPFVGLAGVVQHTDAYAERGGSAAVAGQGGAYGAVLLSFGLAATTEFSLDNGMPVTAHGRLAWTQPLGDAPTATHAFAGGTPFTVAGVAPQGALTLQAGARVAIGGSAELDLHYSGRLSPGASSHAMGATFSMSF